jgi:hypothetical protein
MKRGNRSTHQRQDGGGKSNFMRYILLAVTFLVCCWVFMLVTHLNPMIRGSNGGATEATSATAAVETKKTATREQIQTKTGAAIADISFNVAHNIIEDDYHIVFSTGCSEFQDWQSIGVYSSAEAVGQRGVVTRIASGCTAEQEVAIRHATSHLPKRCRVHFAPGTQVKDHRGSTYKYANKPLGMMHWLMHADPPIPPTATVALVDPDFFFLRPLWHDSFDGPDKYFASGTAKSTAMPKAMGKGVMIAQRYVESICLC